MILLDIAAPICLLIGLNTTTAANASLLNNFEIVATALIAFFLFHEKISKQLSGGIFDPMQIVLIKGICSGLGSLVIGIIVYKMLPAVPYILLTLVLGFLAYGLSIYVYIYAQRYLGAAKTSAYYAVAPFIGTLIFQLPNCTPFHLL